jgi:hypothetical protein
MQLLLKKMRKEFAACARLRCVAIACCRHLESHIIILILRLNGVKVFPSDCVHST